MTQAGDGDAEGFTGLLTKLVRDECVRVCARALASMRARVWGRGLCLCALGQNEKERSHQNLAEGERQRPDDQREAAKPRRGRTSPSRPQGGGKEAGRGARGEQEFFIKKPRSRARGGREAGPPAASRSQEHRDPRRLQPPAADLTRPQSQPVPLPPPVATATEL